VADHRKRAKPARAVTLDVVSLEHIRRGRQAGVAAAAFFSDVESCWARQVSARRVDILRAIAAASVGPFVFKRWQRVVPYRYAMTPLSCAGSVKTQAGGRFNYGGFDDLRYPPFPALYLAEDRETAWAERYGHALAEPGGLTAEELALTRQESVLYLSVSGMIERVVDLREPERLEALVAILRDFEMPAEITRRARELNLPSPTFWTTVDELLEAILDKNWRFCPMILDIPSPPQSFGQLVSASEIGGIVYQSTRAAGGRCCLAVFPPNFSGGVSEVRIDDMAPPSATHTRLDAQTYRDFLQD
jgi:hypothetical protein